MKFKSYISRTYHRNLLEKYLNKYSYLIKGDILDIGSKNRRYDHLFQGKITAIDINPKPELNIIYGNLTKINFEPHSFDSIICLEVFEYLEPEHFKLAFDEIYNVLKKNGKAIISIPFYYGDHKDNIRFTYNFILNYIKQSNRFNFKLFKLGNKYTAIYDMINSKIRQNNSKIMQRLKQFSILYLYYLIIKLFSLENRVDEFYSGIFLVCAKK